MPIPISFAIGMPVPNGLLRFQFFQILMGLSEHPDWERKLEVGVGDGARLVEDTFNSFLWP